MLNAGILLKLWDLKLFNFGWVITDAIVWWFLTQGLGNVLSVWCDRPTSTPHPEDGRITVQNMLMRILLIKYTINTNEHLLVIYIF